MPIHSGIHRNYILHVRMCSIVLFHVDALVPWLIFDGYEPAVDEGAQDGFQLRVIRRLLLPWIWVLRGAQDIVLP